MNQSIQGLLLRTTPATHLLNLSFPARVFQLALFFPSPRKKIPLGPPVFSLPDAGKQVNLLPRARYLLLARR